MNEMTYFGKMVPIMIKTERTWLNKAQAEVKGFAEDGLDSREVLVFKRQHLPLWNSSATGVGITAPKSDYVYGLKRP